MGLAYQTLVFYVEKYVDGLAGLAFGSSINGGIYSASKLYNVSDTALYFIEFSVLMVIVYFHYKKALSGFESLYLSVIVYYMLTSVVGDYQLLLFFVPLFLYPWLKDLPEKSSLQSDMVVFVSIILFLIPKNFDYILSLGAFSQVMINPVIMLISSVYILFLAKDKLNFEKNSNSSI
jgi:hypothetical protein